MLQVPKPSIHGWSSRGLLKGCVRKVAKHQQFFHNNSVLPDQPIKRWAQTSGADLTPAFTNPDVTLILYAGMVVFPTVSFAEADAQQVRQMVYEEWQRRKQGGKSQLPLTMFHRHERDPDGAFVFQTQQGGIGLLQIVSATEKPRSIKIRYKLLISGDAATSARGQAETPQAEHDAMKMREQAAEFIRVATKPGAYDITPGLKLVITQGGTEEQPASPRSVVAELIWQTPEELKPAASYDISVSDGLPYVIGWQEDGAVLWVNCGSMGRGADKKITRYLRTLTVRGPGNVEESTAEVGQVDGDDPKAQQSVPEEVRRAFE